MKNLDFLKDYHKSTKRDYYKERKQGLEKYICCKINNLEDYTGMEIEIMVTEVTHMMEVEKIS